MFDQNLSFQQEVNEEVILDSQQSSALQENSFPEDKISLEVLSKMTGFSEELIHHELFSETSKTSETTKTSQTTEIFQKEVSLETLRAAMLKLIDSTFASEES